MWSIDQRKTKVKCIDCWKEMIKKWQRVRCIKCSNKRDKELAAERRQTQECKDYFHDYIRKYHKEKMDKKRES